MREDGAAMMSPGSNEAALQGCTCPQIDNHYGNGQPRKGEMVFWISSDCPLHARTFADALLKARGVE